MCELDFIKMDIQKIPSWLLAARLSSSQGISSYTVILSEDWRSEEINEFREDLVSLTTVQILDIFVQRLPSLFLSAKPELISMTYFLGSPSKEQWKEFNLKKLQTGGTYIFVLERQAAANAVNHAPHFWSVVGGNVWQLLSE